MVYTISASSVIPGPHDNILVIGVIFGTFALALIIVPLLSRFMDGR